VTYTVVVQILIQDSISVKQAQYKDPVVIYIDSELEKGL